MIDARKFKTRALAVEPLEERWLLSGAWPQDERSTDFRPTPAETARLLPADNWPLIAFDSTATPRIVETNLLSNQDTDEVALDIAEVPASIMLALRETMPGWTPVEASLKIDASTPTYIIGAERAGESIEFTMGLDGIIRETEQNLPDTELPLGVRTIVQEKFPGAELGEAVRVTGADGVTYDVAMLTAEGQQIETTLRLVANRPRLISLETMPMANQSSASAPGVLGSAGESQLFGELAALDSRNPNDLEAKNEVVQAVARSMSRSVGDHVQPFNRAVETELGASTIPEPIETGAAQSLAANLPSAATATAEERALSIVGVIHDSLLLDVAAVERGFNQFLSGLDRLAEDVAGDGDWNDWAARIALAAGVVAGTRLVVLRVRRKQFKLEPAGVPFGARWRWVLGTPDPPRFDPP